MHQMGNAGYALPLHAGGRAHQRTGSDKQYISQRSLPDFRQNKGAQDRRGASASGTSGMDILLLPVIDQQSAVLVPAL